MDFLEECAQRAQRQPPTVVFPEGGDARILAAARRINDRIGGRVVVLGEAHELTELARQAGISTEGFSIISPADVDATARYVERYIAQRPRTKARVAARVVQQPLNFAAMMVATGDAGLMVAGIAHPTRKVIEAAGLCIGLANSVSAPSSFFVMVFPDRTPLIFADCAVNVDPAPAELAEIAISSAESAEKLFGQPAKVALLSFSTKGSASHPRIDKVREALEMARAEAPDLLIDGELQADSALVPEIAASKGGARGPLAGDANVLIFPDLDAANIGYKLVSHLAHARAIGPVLQGFMVPVADLSRGASVDEIVDTAIVALAMC